MGEWEQRELLERFQYQISEYIFVEDKPCSADVILIPGNGYPQPAERAADLWLQGYAPYLLPSGRYSVTAGRFLGVLSEKERYAGDYETEWEFMRHVLVENGVPEQAILREDEATYTWENAVCSRGVSDRAGLTVRRAILCCKNYHARRCLMYYRLAFPEAEFMVCPTCVDGVRRENWFGTREGIDGVLGEVDRIIRQFNLMMK